MFDEQHAKGFCLLLIVQHSAELYVFKMHNMLKCLVSWPLSQKMSDTECQMFWLFSTIFRCVASGCVLRVSQFVYQKVFNQYSESLESVHCIVLFVLYLWLPPMCDYPMPLQLTRSILRALKEEVCHLVWYYSSSF